MAYATTSDVQTYTGVTVTSALITQAQTLIEMSLNITEVGASGWISAQDQDWLKKAVSFQAAYMASHPEWVNLMSVEAVSQGADLSVNFRGNEMAAIITALARRCLKNLSFAGPGTIPVNKGGRGTRPTAEQFLQESLDDDFPDYPWIPMSGSQ